MPATGTQFGSPLNVRSFTEPLPSVQENESPVMVVGVEPHVEELGKYWSVPLQNDGSPSWHSHGAQSRLSDTDEAATVLTVYGPAGQATSPFATMQCRPWNGLGGSGAQTLPASHPVRSNVGAPHARTFDDQLGSGRVGTAASAGQLVVVAGAYNAMLMPSATTQLPIERLRCVNEPPQDGCDEVMRFAAHVAVPFWHVHCEHVCAEGAINPLWPSSTAFAIVFGQLGAATSGPS